MESMITAIHTTNTMKRQRQRRRRRQQRRRRQLVTQVPPLTPQQQQQEEEEEEEEQQQQQQQQHQQQYQTQQQRQQQQQQQQGVVFASISKQQEEQQQWSSIQTSSSFDDSTTSTSTTITTSTTTSITTSTTTIMPVQRIQSSSSSSFSSFGMFSFPKDHHYHPHRPCRYRSFFVVWSLIGMLFVGWFPTHVQSQSSSSSSSSSFNFEIERRILERLEFYMNDPIQTATLLEEFRHNGVFPNQLYAPDRNVFLPIGFGLSQPLVYYALEDGTIPGFYWANGYYREPGNSGYSIYDADMQKHLKSCVNAFTGEPIDCILPQGSQYVACEEQEQEEQETNTNSTNNTNNNANNNNSNNNSGLCPVLKQCPNQPNCEELHVGDALQKELCKSQIKWCRQYTIETNFATRNEFGYIPLTNFCINPKGLFSEQVASVIDPRGTNRNINPTTTSSLLTTTCTHGNGAIVQRSNMIGNYAACGYDNNNNNNNNITTTNEQQQSYLECNTVFQGGYESFEYDPRYRPWYIQTKIAQKPIWLPPYPFFTLGIGVTYTRPIYDIDPESGRSIFAGVLAVDYRFDDISNFLVESYGGNTTTATTTTTAIIIYESQEPNYVIATSTGSDTVTFVLDSDPTKPCPVQRGDDVPCSPVRIPIHEFGMVVGVGDDNENENTQNNPQKNYSPMDIVLANAAILHSQQGYPKYLLSVKRSDNKNNRNDDDEGFFVSQSTLYQEQENANLSWRVIIVAPGIVSTADTIVQGDSLFIAICIIASMGMVGCMIFFILMYTHRNEKAIIFADWRFTCAFIFGCVLLNGSTFTLLGDNTDTTCLLRMWSFHFCFAVALAPLFVKIWRIQALVGQQQSSSAGGGGGLRRTKITNTRAMMMTLPMIIGQGIILLVFTFVDPPKRTEIITTVNDGMMEQSFICDTQTNAFMITSLICEAGFVLIGCILAYSTRHLNDDFGETRQLIFAMYNIAFVGCMTVVITQFVFTDNNNNNNNDNDNDDNNKSNTSGKTINISAIYTIQAIGIFWGTLLSTAAFVIPRMIQVQEMKRRQRNPNSSLIFASNNNNSNYNNNSQSMLHSGNVRISGFVQPSSIAQLDQIVESADEDSNEENDSDNDSNHDHDDDGNNNHATTSADEETTKLYDSIMNGHNKKDKNSNDHNNNNDEDDDDGNDKESPTSSTATTTTTSDHNGNPNHQNNHNNNGNNHNINNTTTTTSSSTTNTKSNFIPLSPIPPAHRLDWTGVPKPIRLKTTNDDGITTISPPLSSPNNNNYYDGAYDLAPRTDKPSLTDFI